MRCARRRAKDKEPRRGSLSGRRGPIGSAPVRVAVMVVAAVVAVLDHGDRRRHIGGLLVDGLLIDRLGGVGGGDHARLAIDALCAVLVVLVLLVVLIALARGLHAQRNPAARVGLGAGGVLAARVFIHHVVAHGAVFVVRLGGAALHVFVLRLAVALDVVAQHRAANHANGRGRRPAAALANGVARCATRNGSHDGARAAGAVAAIDGFIAAHLLRDGHLLHHRGGREHAALLLGVGHSGGAGQGGQGGENNGLFHGETPFRVGT